MTAPNMEPSQPDTKGRADCPCGGSKWDHQRVIDAMSEAAGLRVENQILMAQIETMAEPTELPLWRRISNQRRELKVLSFWAPRWYKMSFQLSNIRSLHRLNPLAGKDDPYYNSDTICMECLDPWPCATIRILDGSEG